MEYVSFYQELFQSNSHNLCSVARSCSTLCTCTATEQKRKNLQEMIELLSEETNRNPGQILTYFEKTALNAFSE